MHLVGRGTARLGETSSTGAERGSLGVLGLAPPEELALSAPRPPSITGHPATGREQASTLWPPHTKLYHRLLPLHSPRPALPCLPTCNSIQTLRCHDPNATSYNLVIWCAGSGWTVSLVCIHLFLELAPMRPNCTTASRNHPPRVLKTNATEKNF